jgi:membrane associated rhomboid family serine protease
LSLDWDLFEKPWNAWQLVTYGFVHGDIWHIAFNMLGLWLFGREVELVYGKGEFYRLYMSLLICAGLVSVAVKYFGNQPSHDLGASGGVLGVAVVFACHFPQRKLMIFPLPFQVPAYMLVAFYVIVDVIGTQNRESKVGHWAHLGGAAFGFLYYRTGWNLFRLWPSKLKVKLPRRGPKLRVHREEQEENEEPANDYMTTGRIQQRVDDLLAKISASGEGSLTDEERQFLAEASRRYQQQRRR